MSFTPISGLGIGSIEELDASKLPEVRAFHATFYRPRGRDLVASRHPDLVILDLQIDNMGGVAVAIDLHLEASAGRVPDVPILLLLDREHDRFLAKRAAANAELVKPIDPGTLRRTVKRLLGQRAGV